MKLQDAETQSTPFGLTEAKLAAKSLHLAEYEIIDSPIDDPTVEGLSDKQIDRIIAFDQRFQADPGGHLEEARAMASEFPDIPKLQQHLAVALDFNDRVEEARELANKVYERFPDYLFGKINHINILIHDGKLDDAERLLGAPYLIHDFAGGRKQFHISEWMSFHLMLVSFHCAARRYEHAKRVTRMLMKTAPDHPLTTEAVFQVTRHDPMALRSLVEERFATRKKQRRKRKNRKRK